MEKTIHTIDDWGCFETDANGRVIDVSPDFCENFLVDKYDLLGRSLYDVVGGMYGRKRKKVFFGVISGIIKRLIKDGQCPKVVKMSVWSHFCQLSTCCNM